MDDCTTTSSEISPLPFYRSVPLPPEASENIRHLGGWESNAVDTPTTAQLIFLMSKGYLPPESLDQADISVLHHIADQMTLVDEKRHEIQVDGFSFAVEGSCAVESGLFQIGEAMRSFGPAMLRRWAHGGIGEPPLRIVTGAAADFSTMVHSSGFLVGGGNYLWNKIRSWISNGYYDPLYNILFIRCTPRNSLYRAARHELGHSVDDFLSPYDSFDSYNYSERVNNAIDNSFGHLDRTSLDPKDHYNYATPQEWFANLFLSCRWAEADETLRGVIRCFLGGKSAEDCTGHKTRRNPPDIPF